MLLYGAIKSHEPEKNYLMGTIVSSIEILPNGISKYLVEIMLPTLDENEHNISLQSFLTEAKTQDIEPDGKSII